MIIPSIQLHPSRQEDLNRFFVFQLDDAAGKMAAFMPKDHTDKAAYMEKYTKLLIDPTINMQTIFIDDNIIGSISKFEMEGHAEITYWIDRKYWGKGIATRALERFLALEKIRPIYGRTAFDNIGSQKVLQHNGFKQIGSDTGYANARQAEIQEFIYRLD
ncbi:GNAT family N-acetyltransferase [Arachidicoccus terrestris]|uniref:GNAT family N-acetyltransferase n=1 Tax=Arachidicoccus terrestris TaxID=2875539 RepID=UPI001CC58E52|nr:GNAT family N-acetyltransferase [Arachidicoccus terrestris]UAY54308.1 GNAT family N-acetyltransferase [Arachidicoccus terrestris]